MDIHPPPGDWLVVLPDHPDAGRVAAGLGAAPQRVDHPSGRPWLLGRWVTGDLRLGTAGRRSLAVLGPGSATAQRLREIAARTSDPAALDGLDLAGSFHLMASLEGVTRFQGSVSGLRRVSRSTVGGITVASTRADVLAGLVGAGIDRRRLALHLLLGESHLTPLDGCLWTGVDAVGGDCCLVQFPDGRGAVRPRWTPPPADRPMPEAARALRTALVEAVQVRLDSGLPLSADLSGGLDSTALCFLAHRDGRELTTVTYPQFDIADEDPVWADRAAGHLPNIARLRPSLAEIPTHYSDILEPGPYGDEPFPCVEGRAPRRMLISRIRQAGSRLHMTGDGGDETVAGGATEVFGLFRRRPRTALRHLRAQRAIGHERWRDVAAAGWDRRAPYAAWLAGRARTVGVSPAGTGGATRTLSLVPWATADAVELVRDALLAEAAADRERGRDWTTLLTLSGIRVSAGLTRSELPLYEHEGIRLTAPFLDDTVIDACMAAPAHLRSTPWAYKALLRAAVRGIVPAACLERTTKAEGSTVLYSALRANAGRLAELCERSRLDDLGLIDSAALRATCTGLNFRPETPLAISLTVGCERWLRDLEASTAPAGSGRTPVPTNGHPR